MKHILTYLLLAVLPLAGQDNTPTGNAAARADGTNVSGAGWKTNLGFLQPSDILTGGGTITPKSSGDLDFNDLGAPTNSQVNTAIAADPAATREAAGVYSTSDAASSAEINSLIKAVLDPAAATYRETTGTPLANAIQISGFLTGLDAIGVRSSFVDGGLYQSRFQPSSGTTAYSILGTADLTITGSPTRHRNGFLFTNDSATAPSSPQRLHGTIPTIAGEWTIITVALRDREADISSGQRRAVNFYDASPLALAIQMQNSGNWQSYTYTGGAAYTMNEPLSPAPYGFSLVAMRNANPGASDSFSTGIIKDDTAPVSTTGGGNVALDRLAIGAGTTNGSAFSQYYDGMVSMWMIFDSVLTDAQLASISSLIDRTLCPKVRWIVDGDSISSTSSGWAWGIATASEWLGRNNEYVFLGVGGETSTQLIARIDKQGATLIATANPSAADTVTIGATTYTFRASVSTTANEVLIGANKEATLVNLIAAINGGNGSGTLYGSDTVANASGAAQPGVSTDRITFLAAATGSDPTPITIGESSAGLQWAALITNNATETVVIGISDAYASTHLPVWYLCQIGSNDINDTADWQETHTNLRTIWAAAKAKGYNVVACTMPGSVHFQSGQSGEYWYGGTGALTETSRASLNAAIAADEGTYFDKLLDVDGFLETTYGADYWDDSAVLSDGVHPSTAVRRAVMNQLWTVVESEMP